MRVQIAAVGRLREGPEHTLVSDYLARAGQAGRALGLGPFDVTEIDDRKLRSAEEADQRLAARLADDAVAVVLDERGGTCSSPDLARELARWRDSGRRAAVFLIGGADGHGPALRKRADAMLSFGPMVWPHMLARVMLAEQLYRAVSILAGSPYHRA